MPVGEVSVRLNLNKDGYSAGMTAARREAQALERAVTSAGHGTVSQMQAASASIRVLEGGMTGNIRAAERFISTIPGIGKALQGIFPIVGGIALAGVFVKIGEEAYKAIHAIEQMRNVTREGLLSMTESSTRSVDNLRLVNDKLEQSIAMLEHKPVNSVALALDEARLKADDLEISLNKDYTAFKKLLEESQTGIFGQMIGKASGKDVQGGINDRLANIRTLGIQQQDQLEDGNTTGAADTLAKIKAAQQEARSWDRQQVAMRQGKMASPNGDMLPYSSFYGNQGQNIDVLQGFGTAVRDQQNIQTEGERNTAAVEQQKKLEAINKANEAAKQAQKLLLSQDEEAEKQQNAFNKLTINEEIQFWNGRISAFTKGGEQYRTVQEKIYDLIAKRPDLTSENKKNQAASGKSAVEGNDLLAAGAQAFQKINLEQLETQNKLAEKYNEIVARGADIAAKNKAAFDEASVSIGLQQGTMSKLAAAQELARIHTQEHADALAAVNRELVTQRDLIGSDKNLTPAEQSDAIRNATNSAGNQTSAINGAYAVTQQRDQADIQGNTIAGAATDSLREMTQNFNDMAATLKNVIPRTIEGLNDDIVKIITGQGKKGDIGHTLLGAGQGLLKGAIQKGEGSIFSELLGKGKQVGSSPSNRQYVSAIIEGAVGGGSGTGVPLPAGITGSALGHIPGFNGSALSDFIHPFMGGSPMAAAASGAGGQPGGGSFFSKLLGVLPGLGGGAAPTDDFGMLTGFQGGFASGGDVLANRPAMIGEQGPEMFVPRTAGRIIPNHQLGGGGDSHTFNIDARGSTDPAAVNAAVMRAAPHIISASVQTQHSASKRSPGGR